MECLPSTVRQARAEPSLLPALRAAVARLSDVIGRCPLERLQVSLGFPQELQTLSGSFTECKGLFRQDQGNGGSGGEASL